VSRLWRSRRSREKDQWRTAKIHRTIRWCTGLSGEPTVDCATVNHAIRERRMACTNSWKGAPDCPVCTGQCPVRHSARRCNGHLRQKRNEIGTRPSTVTVRWRIALSGGASDCPMCHSTEGKDGLPCWPPTTPSCLGAIKGTPRRMEESPQLTRNILRLQDSNFTHSILWDSDLSSI
jgi:hypothetical protein